MADEREEILKNMKIKGISFDLEGPVIDTYELHGAAHILAARDGGVEVTMEDLITRCRLLCGWASKTVIGDIIANFGPQLSLEETLARKNAHYLRLAANAVIPIRTGFRWFLAHVRGLGFRTSIGSATPRDELKLLFQRCGLDALFTAEQIVCREDVAREKPAPDVFLKTADKMEVAPAEQLVIEDGVRGVVAALDAGSRVIGMSPRDRSEGIDPLREARAERVFSRWDEPRLEAFIQTIR